MSEPAYGSREPVPDPGLLHEPAASGPQAPYGSIPPVHYGSPPEPYAPAPGHRPAQTSAAGYVPAGWPTAATTPSERNWAIAAHLSSFVAAMVALSFIGPLVVLLTEGGRSSYVRRHAVEALNFNLSVLLWVVVSALLAFLFVGIPMLLGLLVLYVVSTIRGTVAASRGLDFRYPLTIRFVS